MNRSIELDRLVAAYLEAETIAPAPDGLLESVLAATSRHRPQAAWRGRIGFIGGGDAQARTRSALRIDAALRWVALALLALLAVIGAGSLGIGRNDAAPVQVPASAAPSATLSELPAALAGSWVADQPGSLRFTDPSGFYRMTLSLAATSTLRNSPNGEKLWLRSAVTASATTVQFTTRFEYTGVPRTFPGDGVEVDVPDQVPSQTFLPMCAQGAVGTYTWLVSPDGQTLTLSAVSEACPARQAVYADREWTRVEATKVSGPLRLDRFTPAFTVTLPAADYQISETNVHVDAVGGSVDFAAFVGPQVMRDFCDARGGPIDTAPGGDGFHAALADRPELSVTRHPDRLIDGLPATRLTLTTGGEWCDNANLKVWIPPEGRVWQLPPGDEAELAIVAVDGETVMFQVGVSSPPESPDAVDRILDSIRFIP